MPRGSVRRTCIGTGACSERDVEINTKRKQSHIVTVECKIYRLYSRGVKLPETLRDRAPQIGRLLYRARIAHEQIRLTVFTAQLVALHSDQLVIPPLDSATLIRVNERGMLFCGQEVIARGSGRNSHTDYYQQEWVCKPLSMG